MHSKHQGAKLFNSRWRYKILSMNCLQKCRWTTFRSVSEKKILRMKPSAGELSLFLLQVIHASPKLTVIVSIFFDCLFHRDRITQRDVLRKNFEKWERHAMVEVDEKSGSNHCKINSSRHNKKWRPSKSSTTVTCSSHPETFEYTTRYAILRYPLEHAEISMIYKLMIFRKILLK